jgi:hypothetical protein
MTVEPPMLMPMGIDARPLFKSLTRVLKAWRDEVDFNRNMDALYQTRRAGVPGESPFPANSVSGKNVNIMA